MKKQIAVALIGASSLLAGCGESGPEVMPGVEATVYAHAYDDWDVLSYDPYLIDSAHYYLDVEQCGHEKSTKNELGCVAIRVEVTPEAYAQYPDGSKITFQAE